MENQEEVKPKRYYRIEAGDKVKIKRTDFNGYTFYKVPLTKKNKNGAKETYEKTVVFPKDADIPDGSYVRIKDFYEDMYFGKVDRFNPIWTIRELDYEIVDEEVDENSAIADYLNEVAEDGIDISDDLLPF